MFEGCDECSRLRNEYSSATVDLLRIDNKLKRAILMHDPDAVRVLSAKIETAASDRARAREAIRQHEALAHAPQRTSGWQIVPKRDSSSS